MIGGVYMRRTSLFLIPVFLFTALCSQKSDRKEEPPEQKESFPSSAAKTATGMLPPSSSMGETITMSPQMLQSIIDLPGPEGLERIAPPDEWPIPAGPKLSIITTRTEWGEWGATAYARYTVGDPIVIAVAGCRLEDFLTSCWIKLPSSIGWSKYQNFLRAIQSRFPPEPVYGLTDWFGRVSLSYGETGRIHVRVILERGYVGNRPLYFFSCLESDPKCIEIWNLSVELFWMPLKFRYPFLPELGDPLYNKWGWIDSKTPEGKAYLNRIPEIDEKDTRTYTWTEKDESAFQQWLKEKKSEGKPVGEGTQAVNSAPRSSP